LICVSGVSWAQERPESVPESTPSVQANTLQKEADLARQKVRFDGETFQLAFQNETPQESLKEFLPAGQNLEKWTKFAALHGYAGLDDPKAFAESLVNQLKDRSPDAEAKITDGANNGEVAVEFVVWPDDKSFAEFNVFKFKKGDGGALIGEQYALRNYDNPKQFVKDLESKKSRLVKLMLKDGLELDSREAPSESVSESKAENAAKPLGADRASEADPQLNQ
jgi:hypothetical protein